MNKRSLLWGVSLALLLCVLLAFAWLLRSGAGKGSINLSGARASGSNPALDVKYSYDPRQFKPGKYDPAGELPLLLDGLEQGEPAWIFGGKRIKGVAIMLAKEPGPMLYDFVGSQEDEAFVDLYHLTPQGKPIYEDAHFKDKLALHTRQVYTKGEGNAIWPGWFPPAVTAGNTAYVEGWALFSPEDLFFFYAVSPQELSEAQRRACEQVMESLRFGAVLGGSGKGMEEAQPEGEGSAPSGQAPSGQAPAGSSGSNAPPAGSAGGK